MRLDRTVLVKLGLFACLALTAWKGLMKLPEVFPVVNPEGFYRSQVNDGENTLIMKERHFDFNIQTGNALALRLEEMVRLDENPPPEALVTRERTQRALRKTLAKDLRNADYVLLAEEKLARALRRQAQGWRAGWLACPAGSLSASDLWRAPTLPAGGRP